MVGRGRFAVGTACIIAAAVALGHVLVSRSYHDYANQQQTGML